MADNNKYNKYGIENIVDIKHTIIKDVKEFEEALEALDKTKYFANTAERRRAWSKKFVIKIRRDSAVMDEIFKIVTLSFYAKINNKLTFEDLCKSGYANSDIDGNIHYFEVDKDKYYFSSVFIHKDIIYRDIIQAFPMKYGYALKFYKIIKVPFPREYMSQNTHFANFSLNKQWKQYKFSMMRGVNSCM